jgi:hypothetical protein
MKDKEIYNKWTEFITDDQYKQYIIIDFKELWYQKLEKIKNYIDKNNKTPSKHNKDIKQIGQWISNQKINYDIDINKCKEGMKDKEIYNKWTEFITNNKYKQYFKTVNNKI